MSSNEPLYRAVYDADGHLAQAGDGGFLGAVLNNSDNVLIGQARFFEVDPDDLKNETNDGNPDLAQMNVLFLAVGVAVGILAAVVVVKSAPRIRAWWSETVRPGIQSFWNRIKKHSAREGGAERQNLLELAAPVEPATISNKLALIASNDSNVMSSAEAKQRYLAMMLAVAFAAEQLSILEGARIEDPEKLKELRRAAAQLSTQEAVNLANRILESDESLLDDKSQSMFMAVFGGGRKAEGKYFPIMLDRMEQVMRLPKDEE